LTGPAPLSTQHLVRIDRVGPAIAAATGIGDWTNLSAELVSGGKSNLTFELVSAAGSLILRRPPSGELLPSAHDMGREARIQRALAPTPVPVAPIVLEDGGDLIGVPFYVMEKMPGHVIRGELPDGYATTPKERRLLTYTFVDTLAALHAVDPDKVGLGDYGRPNGFLERQIRRWGGQWQASRTTEVAAVEELGRRLRAARPAESANTIVHGDFRLDNCLLDPADPGRIAAVLDWELSTLGDPLTDLGMLLFFWRGPGEDSTSLTPGVTHLPGFPDRAEVIARYQAQTGYDLSQIAYYEAFAHYKFAIIAQGIAARVHAGSMGGQDFGNLDDEVRDIAAQGLQRLS
jgi:aminoglycoside phosphotransferase (APT) family kinase protein